VAPVRERSNKALLAAVTAALVSALSAAAPAAAGGLEIGPELEGLQAFEIDWRAEFASIAAPATGAIVAPPLAVYGVNDEVLTELNFARAHPQDYARALLSQPVSDWERGLARRPDPADVAEAVVFLQRQAPLSPLRADEQLAAAAFEHVATQGAAGQIGHEGPAGEAFDARLRRHGAQGRMWGENIAYGPVRASDVVRELIIDSGVPDRGHRRNIFYPDFAAAGVSCGPHRDYAAMCVMDFSSPAQPHVSWRQAGLTPATEHRAH
jgi:uncharacterized protein YkwD